MHDHALEMFTIPYYMYVHTPFSMVLSACVQLNDGGGTPLLSEQENLTALLLTTAW